MIAFIVHAARADHVRVKRLRNLCEADPELSSGLWLQTEHRGHAIDLARHVVRMGASIVVAVGGDGTVNEVANGLAASSVGSSDVRMAVFPVGSGNDCARSLGVPRDPKRFVTLLKDVRFQGRTIDLLAIRCTPLPGDDSSAAIERLCVNVADAGLGGYVAGLVSRTPSWWNADLRYFLGGLVGILRYAKHRVRVEWSRGDESSDDVVWEGCAMTVCFANFSTFGSGIVIAPHAVPDDGRMAITIIGDVSVLEYLRWMPSLRVGTTIRHPDVVYAQSTKLRITSEVPHHVEIDGEVVGTTPVEVTVLPQRIRMIC